MASPRRAARTAFGRLAAVVVAALVLAGLAGPAAAQRQAPEAPAAQARGVVVASPGTEAQFVSRINSLRASKGLSQLAVSGELTGVARRWTQQMVDAGQISHNPNLGSQVSGSWTKLGENVGVGYDVDGLMQAFINSASHYRNLVDPEWTHVGVGVIILGDGTMYTTHNFMALPAAAPPPPPPPPPPSPTPTTAPPSTATTAAPETTTTTTEPPRPSPTPDRVTAVLDPLRSLEES
ncbi:MAG: CAP domain-containing protein [Acidimicrobiia bacterium]